METKRCERCGARKCVATQRSSSAHEAIRHSPCKKGRIDTTTPIVAYRVYEEHGELKSEPIWADEMFKKE